MIIKRLYDVLYPPRCPGCDDILYDRGRVSRPMVCPKCDEKILRVKQPACMKCGKPLDAYEEEYCADCAKKNHEYNRGIATFVYSETMKRSMYGFKYNGRREYANFYAAETAGNWSHIIRMWNADALIPVPLHPAKLRKRGYNQAEDFARALSGRLDIPVVTDVLQRVKNTRPQKELDDKGRNQNINNAFKIKNNIVRYKKIVLIDDIYTTGTTINECAKVLKGAGVSEIYFVTVCIGKGF